MLELAYLLLDDDYGITQEAYEKLIEKLQDLNVDKEAIDKLHNSVRCSDGRCYIPN